MEKNIAATLAALKYPATFTINCPRRLNAETEKTERFLIAAFTELEAQKTPMSRAIEAAIFPPEEIAK
jgi:hypothetical protein